MWAAPWRRVTVHRDIARVHTGYVGTSQMEFLLLGKQTAVDPVPAIRERAIVHETNLGYHAIQTHFEWRALS